MGTHTHGNRLNMHGARNYRLPSVSFVVPLLCFLGHLTLAIGLEKNFSELRLIVAAIKLMRTANTNSRDFDVENMKIE